LVNGAADTLRKIKTETPSLSRLHFYSSANAAFRHAAQLVERYWFRERSIPLLLAAAAAAAAAAVLEWVLLLPRTKKSCRCAMDQVAVVLTD
jgi:hypothetical protein